MGAKANLDFRIVEKILTKSFLAAKIKSEFRIVDIWRAADGIH